MAEETKTFEQLGEISNVPPAADDQPVHVQKLDAHGRAYATGKRKNAIARVWIKPGKGKITVNDKDFTEYFARPVLQMLLQQPIHAFQGKNDLHQTGVMIMKSTDHRP